MKLISLLFAIFLWYFVSSEDRVDMNVQIPVEIVNLPRDLIVANQYKNMLDVTVSGPRGLIRKISANISRSIDLSKATPGNAVIANEPDSIPVPRGISVLRINPTHITLVLDRMIKKDLPVKAITQGKLPEEYELVGITMQPEHLEISGPQDVLGRETVLPTTPIDLSEVTSSTSKQVALDLRQEVADLIGDPLVSAKIEIKDKLIEREVSRIEIKPTGLPQNQTVKLSQSRLAVKVLMPMVLAKKQRSNLDELFSATINLEGLPPGVHEVKPMVKAPPDVTIQAISRETVTVEIK
ncbi:MAG: CdaR family protein [Desulfobulbaceae bacterium]|nr:CdaR family protein [Desulfobulbaceae bacterium]